MDSNERRGAILVLLSACAFSTAGLFTRLITVDVWTLLLWRGLFGGAFITACIVWRDGGRAATTLRRIGLPGLVAAACSALATICFVNALRLTTVADVLVIGATAPFLTAAMARAWSGLRERRRTLLASGVALLGVAVTVAPALGTGHLLGDALALLMALLLSAMMVVIRQRRAVCMLPAAALSAFLCAALVWPLAQPASASGWNLAGLALFGTVQFGLGLLLMTVGTRLVSATRSALIGTLDTPLAPALVWLVLGEAPPLIACLGGAIVLAAVVYDITASPKGSS